VRHPTTTSVSSDGQYLLEIESMKLLPPDDKVVVVVVVVVWCMLYQLSHNKPIETTNETSYETFNETANKTTNETNETNETTALRVAGTVAAVRPGGLQGQGGDDCGRLLQNF
jgi:hypothetical protein